MSEVSYLHWDDGTKLGFGQVVDSRGSLRGVRGPTHYLVRPEGDEPEVWVPAGHVDFAPLPR